VGVNLQCQYNFGVSVNVPRVLVSQVETFTLVATGESPAFTGTAFARAAGQRSCAEPDAEPTRYE
jgi:hypothetical protein